MTREEKMRYIKGFYEDMGYQSYAEMARALGVSRVCVRQWMLGMTVPTEPTLKLIEYMRKEAEEKR